MKRNFERYCKDYQNIENYDKAATDGFKGWDCHHRLETHNSDGERRLVNISAAELKALGMYYNRPASELVFLTIREHRLLHNEGENNPMYGKQLSEETKKRLSEYRKGENNAMYGKHHSEESKIKMRIAHKGKKLGKDNPFYGKTHSEETRKKLSEAQIGNTNVRGTRWYNDGKINIRAKECPPGFILGRLRK